MALKPFHIVLILSAIALGIGVGMWGMDQYSHFHRVMDFGTGAGGFMGSVLLSSYLIWFLRKAREKGW